MKVCRFFVLGYQINIENWPKNLFFKKEQNIFDILTLNIEKSLTIPRYNETLTFLSFKIPVLR